MAEKEPEITFPTIRFPILGDLQMNAMALAGQYGTPPPETVDGIATVILTNTIVRLFCNERIAHRPGPDSFAGTDARGACFLYVIGAAICRILQEQGHEVDHLELYRRCGNALFQACSPERIEQALEEGQTMAEGLFDEAMENGEVNEFVLHVMSLGVLYAIEPREGTLDELAVLFERSG